jgi:uncharacterized protein (DUF305 family)
VRPVSNAFVWRTEIHQALIVGGAKCTREGAMNDTNILPHAERIRFPAPWAAAVLFLCGSPVLSESGVPLIQPGAPGEAGRTITAAQSAALARSESHPADAQFVSDMIVHHAQALDMVELLKVRTRRQDMRLLGQRIAISQRDEIEMMRMWLLRRGEALPDSNAHNLNGAHAHAAMPSMLTPEQMNALAAANGLAFDRLFLQGMIRHHQGALDMVRELRKTSGAAEEPALFDFTASVVADQSAEIARMQDMVARLPVQ